MEKALFLFAHPNLFEKIFDRRLGHAMHEGTFSSKYSFSYRAHNVYGGTLMFYVMLGFVAILFFSLQLLLCRKSRKRIVKSIPLILVLLGTAYGIAVWFGLFGLNGWQDLIAMIIFLFVGIALLATLAAFLYVWAKERSKRSEKS